MSKIKPFTYQIWPPHLCITCFRTYLDVCRKITEWIFSLKSLDPPNHSLGQVPNKFGFFWHLPLCQILKHPHQQTPPPDWDWARWSTWRGRGRGLTPTFSLKSDRNVQNCQSWDKRRLVRPFFSRLLGRALSGETWRKGSFPCPGWV